MDEYDCRPTLVTSTILYTSILEYQTQYLRYSGEARSGCILTDDERSAMFSGESIMNAKFTNQTEELATMKFGTVLVEQIRVMSFIKWLCGVGKIFWPTSTCSSAIFSSI